MLTVTHAELFLRPPIHAKYEKVHQLSIPSSEFWKNQVNQIFKRTLGYVFFFSIFLAFLS